jgi:hypothetical protein
MDTEPDNFILFPKLSNPDVAALLETTPLFRRYLPSLNIFTALDTAGVVLKSDTLNEPFTRPLCDIGTG